MNPSKALLVIDIQQDFTGPAARMPVDPQQASRMIENVNLLSSTFAASGWPVVYIGNEYSVWNPLNVFRNFAAIKNTPGIQLDERLQGAKAVYFSKSQGNALSNSNLVSYLNAQKINKLYVTGLYAEACLLATIRGAIRHQFSVTAVTDAIATKTEAKRQKMITQYAQLGALVVPTSSLINPLN
jgi:maleamate amidohydrolase